MYFDDDEAQKEVQALCSLSCAACAASPAGPKTFASLPLLQAHLRKAHSQSMCEICLLGRNVFISQHVLYSKTALERHMASGAADAGNALGEAGFKGHPLCSFCSTSFYGGGELFTHMQREHFTARPRPPSLRRSRAAVLPLRARVAGPAQPGLLPQLPRVGGALPRRARAV